MALFEVVNTEMQVLSPLGGSFEAVFGQAALTLLERNDHSSIGRLMELYGQAREITGELEKLVSAKKK